MKILSILLGLALTVLGIISYTTGDAESIWSLAPALFGLLAILFGFLQGRWKHYHAVYGVVMLAILTLLASIRGIWSLIVWLTGGQPAMANNLILIHVARGFLSALFIALAIVLVKNFWRHWKEFGQFLGNWLGRVVLTIFYFTVFVPFGLGVRLFADPLHIKKQPDEFWQPRTTGDQKLEDVLRQF
jgi:hypothetical protein